MSTILYSILSFIVVFAIVVAVHEFGHFWVARRCGVKILRFSIGFGPVLWKRKDKQGTEFALAAVPLGGYVKMLDGREQTLVEADIPFAFDHKPVLQRIAIVAAGPLFNFLFAILAYAVILMMGVHKVVPIIADVIPNSVAAKAGIQIDDEIVRINNKDTPDWQAVYFVLLETVGDPEATQVTVRQFPDQPLREYALPPITLSREQSKQPDPLKEWGITLGLPHVPAILGEVLPNQPAELAGLRAGDEILMVNEQSVRDWYVLVEHIRRSPNQTLTLAVKRGDEKLSITLTPLLQSIEGEEVGVIGVKLAPITWPEEFSRVQHANLFSALYHSFIHTWDLSKLTFIMMGKMLTGKISVDNLAGPLSIAQGAQESAETGWISFVGFLVLLSVNLGVINLLPIPILDGGHLMYYVIEWIRGRPVSDAAQRVGLIMGIAVILGLMVIGLHNDIMGFWR